MSAIGPGDWVECVVDAPCPLYGPVPLRHGAIYCVSNAATGRVHGLFIVSLVGVSFPRGFGARRFRPIYRPKSELIETLLRKADEPVKEDA